MSERKFTIDEVGPRIENFLIPILKHARFRVTPEVKQAEIRYTDFENPDIAVNFTGPDVDLLLANKAEVLLALEHLTLEMLGVLPNEHSLLAFDANDHRMMRIEELRLSALTAAEKVKSGGRPFHFNPMTSRERRILHLALNKEPEVRSESAGAGPYRAVVIYPAGMPSSPSGPATAPAHLRGRRRR